MQRLEASGPTLDALSALDEMTTDDRSHPDGRPWVSTDMVMSLDGAYSRDGVSGGLSSAADHDLFIAHRSLSDAILVGAATVRAERYRRPLVSDAAAEIRERRGQTPLPLLVVTSASLDLGTDTPLLQGDPPHPVVAHPASSDTSAAPPRVELLQAGEHTVDLRAVLGELAARGVATVACEGGPGLLGQLAAEDLIDEYLVTVSPQLVGGTQVGLLGGVDTAPREFELHRVMRDGAHLMCSYHRRRIPHAGPGDPPGPLN